MRALGPERSVMVALPAYDGRLDTHTLFAITDFQSDCLRRGWGFGITTAVASAPISVARSQLAMEFLDSNATDLFYIDADIGCERGAMVRMVEHPVDFVLGVYPERQLNRSYTLLGLIDGTFTRDPINDLVAIQGGPAGFMRVKRHVIQRMMDERDIAYDYLVSTMDIKIPMIFHTIIGAGFTCSEDINFCLRWRELGGEVWLDPDVRLTHTGRLTMEASFWNDFAVPNKLVTA